MVPGGKAWSLWRGGGYHVLGRGLGVARVNPTFIGAVRSTGTRGCFACLGTNSASAADLLFEKGVGRGRGCEPK